MTVPWNKGKIGAQVAWNKGKTSVKLTGKCAKGLHVSTWENTYVSSSGSLQCRLCRRVAQGEYEHSPAGIKTKRRASLKRRGGWTEELHDQAYEDQSGRCAICDCELVKPYHDHDHVTETPRGLLCLACNSGLGQFKDDTTLLESAIAYLRKWQKL